MARTLPDYPWDKVVPFSKRAAQHPDGIVDLSIGSPVDPTPDLIRDALSEATEAHSYPTTVGTGELRQAIVDWYARRRGTTGLGTSAVLPSIGSKELIGTLPFALGLGPGDVIVQPSAAYPTYEMGAALVGATILRSDDPDEWPEGTAVVWLNSPGNPDGRVIDAAELRRAVIRARELGALIINDECYAELGWEGRWAETPTPSILADEVLDGLPDVPGQEGDRFAGILSVYSLSKQSNLAGYRSAFVAGGRATIAELLVVRKHLGLMMPAPVQHATAVALGDDAHGAAQKRLYRARREVLLPAFEQYGFTVKNSEAGLYLWLESDVDCWTSVAELADLGILVGPGEFYGEGVASFIRVSLTATDERIAAAADRLRSAQPMRAGERSSTRS